MGVTPQLRAGSSSTTATSSSVTSPSTILRNFTNGEKVVRGDGSTLLQVINDVESRHPGLKARLVEDSGLRRFVNVYVNDEDVRFTGGLGAPTTDGDVVVVLPAVAGGC